MGNTSVCQIRDFASCVHFWKKVVSSLFRSLKSNQKALELHNLCRCAPWHFRAIPASLSCYFFLSTYHMIQQIYTRRTLPYLVPLRRFPSPSRSIHFGNVFEANKRETFSLGPCDPKRFGRAE